MIESFTYDHPVITHASVAAQSRWGEISGVDGIHYCGAYWRWGFHEDGCWSAHARLRARSARRLSPRTPSWSSRRERSALYEGWVRHRRLDPVEHRFRYPIFMAYLDLASCPEALDPLARLVGAASGARLVSTLRSPRRPEIGRSTVWSATGSPSRDRRRARTGPVRLLTNLRYFGHCFNPVSFFFCFDRSAGDGRGRARRGQQHPLGRDRTPT